MLERMALPLRGLSNGIASAMRGFYGVLGGPGRLLQDFLNGSWLGHSLHAVLVDIVIGGATVAVVAGRASHPLRGRRARGRHDLDGGLVFLSALGADRHRPDRLQGHRTTTRPLATSPGCTASINIVATIGFGISLWLRAGRRARRRLLGPAGLVPGRERGRLHRRPHRLQVRLHGELQRLLAREAAAEFTPVVPVAEVPENTPTKVTFGATSVMLVRRGEVVHALKDTCSHLGGPLSKGELDGRPHHLPVALLGLPHHRWRGRCTGRRRRARCRIAPASTTGRWSSRARTTEDPPLQRIDVYTLRRHLGHRLDFTRPEPAPPELRREESA